MSNKSIYQKICEEKKLPLFMQPWWLDTVCDNWDVAIARKGEEVTGVWAYPVEKTLSVTMLRNPMLTPYLGPHVFYPDEIKESKADRFEHETVSELIRQLPPAKMWRLAIEPGMKQAGIFRNNNLRPEVQQTFLIGLNEDEETLFNNMKDTTRRNIRAAEKEITISNSPEHLDELFAFQRHTLENKGKAQVYTLNHLRKIMDACLTNGAAALWVAKNGADIQAIVWQVWDEKNSYYFMGGQNHEANSYRAMSALLWHAIKEGKKKGHATFDLEGSMDEGVERFFRNFGGSRTLYLVLHRNDSILWKLKKMILK